MKRTAVRRPKRSADVRVISLRTPGLMLRENDRLNEEFAGEYIAYLDRRKGDTVYRRIIAHSASLKAVNDAIDKLSRGERARVMVHYALQMPPDTVFQGGSSAEYIENAP